MTNVSVASARAAGRAAERAAGRGGEAAGEPLALESAALGRIEVPADAVYAFDPGLVGFEAYRRFALVAAGRPGVFWLQSLDEPALAFVVADPFALAEGYAADVPDACLEPLGVTRPEELMLLAVVTLPGAPGAPATANLRAPLLLNVVTRRARQVVLADDRYGVAHPVSL